jgi:hypothetical protein
MSPGQRALRTQILFILHRDQARSVGELSEMTGQPVSAVRSACWALCHAGQVAFCGHYVAFAPRRAGRRSA